eukprot:CAMPEP_0117649658 /NCGR_PEP_ID=MMETSP0804-20121206/1097_1 /TAXON_ID=1074897 /ORGANISM="Tetraselmis astigmatica, Strain CCMP880" /LENGTH=181 /DNA_ID=CAMNT_0005455425 /DNA_START=182 /DNA_END=727 /DNA_ORIENTATION=+
MTAETMNQTMSNGVLPALIHRIATSTGLGHPVNAYTAIGGCPDWRQAFPPCGYIFPAAAQASAGSLPGGFSSPMRRYLQATSAARETSRKRSPRKYAVTPSIAQASPSPSWARSLLQAPLTPSCTSGAAGAVSPPPSQVTGGRCSGSSPHQQAPSQTAAPSSVMSSPDQCHPNDRGYLRLP